MDDMSSMRTRQVPSGLDSGFADYDGVTVTSSYAPEGEAAFASMDDAFEAASPHLAALIIGAGELEVGEDSEAA